MYRDRDGMRRRMSGLFGAAGECEGPPVRLRGNMRRAVVVPSPDRRFTEAVFILRDELFRESGVSGNELLSEAKSAAESYVTGCFPKRPRRACPPLLIFLSGMLTALLIMLALGLI